MFTFMYMYEWEAFCWKRLKASQSRISIRMMIRISITGFLLLTYPANVPKTVKLQGPGGHLAGGQRWFKWGVLQRRHVKVASWCYAVGRNHMLLSIHTEHSVRKRQILFIYCSPCCISLGFHYIWCQNFYCRLFFIDKEAWLLFLYW